MQSKRIILLKPYADLTLLLLGWVSGIPLQYLNEGEKR